MVQRHNGTQSLVQSEQKSDKNSTIVAAKNSTVVAAKNSTIVAAAKPIQAAPIAVKVNQTASTFKNSSKNTSISANVSKSVN